MNKILYFIKKYYYQFIKGYKTLKVNDDNEYIINGKTKIYKSFRHSVCSFKFFLDDGTIKSGYFQIFNTLRIDDERPIIIIRVFVFDMNEFSCYKEIDPEKIKLFYTNDWRKFYRLFT